MHRLCDVLFFSSNIVKNIEVDVFFKTLLKHRIVKQKVQCFTRCFYVSENPLRETNNLSQISKDLLQFSISLKLLPNTSLICIVSTMFQLCLNMVKTSRSIFSSKHRLKIASLIIWKHRIIKKSEHCPPLLMQSSQLVTKDNNQTREGMRAGETIAQEGWVVGVR